MNGNEWKNRAQSGEEAKLQAGAEERELEQALTRALRRVDAPAEFAARVMALAEAEERTARAAKPERAPWWRFSLGWKPAWGAVAAMGVAAVLTGHAVHEHRAEEQARVQASREFDVSVQITNKALEHAREQLLRKGVALDGDGQ